MSKWKKWSSIIQQKNERLIVTEKMDGTNVSIEIHGDNMICRSRSEIITGEGDLDHHGFLAWCYKNRKNILKLGDGIHYGEFCGPGIVKNRHGFPDPVLFLFKSPKMRDEDFNIIIETSGLIAYVPIVYKGTRDGYDPEALRKSYLPVSGDAYLEGFVEYCIDSNHYAKRRFVDKKGRAIK